MNPAGVPDMPWGGCIAIFLLLHAIKRCAVAGNGPRHYRANSLHVNNQGLKNCRLKFDMLGGCLVLSAFFLHL